VKQPERTGEAVGDGTTTSTLLAHAILAEGIRNVAAGTSAFDLRRGLTRGLKVAVASLRTLSRPVANQREKAQVATISAHGDSTVGGMVAEAVEKVGADGAITVEESKTTDTVLEIVEGMQFDRGFISPYFVTDPGGDEAALDEPLILIHEKLSIGKGPASAPRTNRAVGKASADHCAAVKAPEFGDRRKAMLQDIAILTGGQLIAEELGIKLENVTVDQLGRAKRVEMDKDTITIVAGSGVKSAIDGRCQELRKTDPRRLVRTTTKRSCVSAWRN
jgi:chaperonin GroEL